MDQTQKPTYKPMEQRQISPFLYDHLNFGKSQKYTRKKTASINCFGKTAYQYAKEQNSIMHKVNIGQRPNVNSPD